MHGGFQPGLRKPSHTNAELSHMALLHLFSIYKQSFQWTRHCIGVGFQYCIWKIGPKIFWTVYLFAITETEHSAAHCKVSCLFTKVVSEGSQHHKNRLPWEYLKASENVVSNLKFTAAMVFTPTNPNVWYFVGVKGALVNKFLLACLAAEQQSMKFVGKKHP